MIELIELIAWALVIPVAVPVLMFAVECAVGAASRAEPHAELHAEPHAEPHADQGPQPQPPPPMAVLIPAHNEAAGIAETIRVAAGQLRAQDRLIVVADNCDDATAAIARTSGAEVVERFSQSERGKGFALAAGAEFLAAAAPAVVIVLDADCQPEPGALQRLAAHAVTHGAAVQGRYLLASTGDTHPSAQLSLFAFVIKNLVRQRALHRLGSPALLQGTGMAFAWPIFARAPLASGCLVEDLELGLGLVLAGDRVLFLPSAGFQSPASSRDATVGQRTRWEHGTILTGWRYIPALLMAGVRRPALLLLALDLAIPPMALLALILGAATSLAALLVIIGASPVPLLVLLGLAALFVLAVGHGWHHAGRDCLAPSTFLGIPGYLLWKLPVYARLVFDRQRTWVRTSRDA